jgi:hypothetical protein
MGDEAFPQKTYLLKPYPGSHSKGDNEKSTFPIQESSGKCIWNIMPGISNLSEDPTLIAGEEGQHYFCDLYFA